MSSSSRFFSQRQRARHEGVDRGPQASPCVGGRLHQGQHLGLRRLAHGDRHAVEQVVRHGQRRGHRIAGRVQHPAPHLAPAICAFVAERRRSQRAVAVHARHPLQGVHLPCIIIIIIIIIIICYYHYYYYSPPRWTEAAARPLASVCSHLADLKGGGPFFSLLNLHLNSKTRGVMVSGKK